MAKGNSQKKTSSNDSGLNCEAQLSAAAHFTTWKLARMNLAIRGIDASLGLRNADSFQTDLHPDLKAGFKLANPRANDQARFGGPHHLFGSPSLTLHLQGERVILRIMSLDYP